MNTLVVVSNMQDEIDQLEEWFGFVAQIAQEGILIVDSGSKDGTIEEATKRGAVVIQRDTIKTQGYGPARNELRRLAKEYFPMAHWCLILDADERIEEKDFHQLRYLQDYLADEFDLIALPRIDWEDKEKSKAHNDYTVSPDWQSRMSRLNSSVEYYRRVHEQVRGFRGLWDKLTNPVINHYHRSRNGKKTDQVGKICAYLHSIDNEYGHTVQKHHKEDHYYQLYQKEGLD